MLFKHLQNSLGISMAYRAVIPTTVGITIIGTLAALAGAAGTASVHLVTNGDFAANAAKYQAAPGYSGKVNPNFPTGWTLPANATSKLAVAVGVNGSDTGVGAPFGPTSSAAVKDFAFMQGGANFISQTVTTTAGQAYTLTYEAAARADHPGTAAVLITDTTDGKVFTSQAPAITDARFKSFSLTFTAPSASTRIEFQNTTVGGNSALDVSNVVLKASGG